MCTYHHLPYHEHIFQVLAEFLRERIAPLVEELPDFGSWPNKAPKKPAAVPNGSLPITNHDLEVFQREMNVLDLGNPDLFKAIFGPGQNNEPPDGSRA